ncbi:DEHA2D15136p [Debaryomyces hansenii CBS767]|uniref:DEHA2D15136p n=1 Tax=Debaryomyces hansenii (strain ATCC 36239 / CBS 767 / BCRC 21394 / JCM 1990 / NBRC 0083 / IGC 2968) TaxID=284592 RepID=Q6BRN0_DEBHA|nr:DEHA2D15136p [Debaryomyces hansenii CBS767]CAG87311.2 DEHA2D15136p [Debaryomyces hansenii CBS767]|eukprot:XP_459140.2 DEHA2D15136p [Debaryomyces hansenii CBS767]
MDGSYNNDHRVYNQLSPLESSNTVNAIFSQINQLNNHFTNYQISNNKKIESINQKVNLQFNAINETLNGLSKQVNVLSRKISMPTKDSTPRNDDKVLEIFNKHINKLSNDIQELSSSLYTGNDNLNRQLGSEKDTVSVGRDLIQNGDVGQKNNYNYRHAESPEIMAVDMDIDNRNRSWPKSLSLRSPAPQPNSAPSSPFTNRYIDFPALLERNTTIGNDINYGNQNGIIENPELRLEEVQRINTNKGETGKKKSKTNISETEASGSQPYIYSLMNSRQQISLQGTKAFQSSAKRPSPKNNSENLTQYLQGQILKSPEYQDLDNHNQIHRTSIMSNQSRTSEIGPDTDVTPKSFGQVPNIATEKRENLELNTVKEAPNTTMEKPHKQSKSNIPGVTLLKGKKLSTTPQYKLEKSLRNVFEIWKEYEYGINGKPPLRQLEAQYNTKWRNETESRTFLRRKKIYDAIEKGKKVGYHERQIIEELELLRTYDSFGVVKKKPLSWLYSNIPRKFC